MAGSLHGSVDFGAGPVDQVADSGFWNAGDLVLLALDEETGETLWSQQYPGVGESSAGSRFLDVGVDSGGQIVVLGMFEDVLNVGQGAYETEQGPYGGDTDAFIAAFQPDGSPKWSHHLKDPEHYVWMGQVAIDPWDNIAVTGALGNELTLGDQYVEVNGGESWLLQLDRCGTLLWAKTVRPCGGCGGGAGVGATLHPRDLAVDGQGDLVVTAEWAGPLNLQDALLTDWSGGVDGMIAWIDGSGQKVLEPDLSLPICVPSIEPETLSVALTGPGGGRVVSDPEGIDCPGECSGVFASLSEITLTATPDDDASFAGWSGACSGLGTCKIVLAQHTEVEARFERPALLWSAAWGHEAGESIVDLVQHPDGGVTWIGGAGGGTFDVGFGPEEGLAYQQLVLVHLDAGGVPAWHHAWPMSDAYSAMERVALAPDGGVVVTGKIAEPTDFGGGELAPSGSQGRFLARYTADGQHMWSETYPMKGGQRCPGCP